MNYCLPELSSIWWPPYQPLLHHTLRVLAGWGPPQLLSRVYLSGAQVSQERRFKCFFERLMFPIQSTSQSQHTRDHFHPEVGLKFPRRHHRHKRRVANASFSQADAAQFPYFLSEYFSPVYNWTFFGWWILDTGLPLLPLTSMQPLASGDKVSNCS